MRSILVWTISVPIPVIILIALFMHLLKEGRLWPPSTSWVEGTMVALGVTELPGSVEIVLGFL